MTGGTIELAVFSKLPDDRFDYRVMGSTPGIPDEREMRSILFETFGIQQFPEVPEPILLFGPCWVESEQSVVLVAIRLEVAPYHAWGDTRDVRWAGFAMTAIPKVDRQLVAPSILMDASPSVALAARIEQGPLDPRPLPADSLERTTAAMHAVVDGIGVTLPTQMAVASARRPIRIDLGNQGTDAHAARLFDSIYLLAPPNARARLGGVIGPERANDNGRKVIRMGLLDKRGTRIDWDATGFAPELAEADVAYVEVIEHFTAANSVETTVEYLARFAHAPELDAPSFSARMRAYTDVLPALRDPALPPYARITDAMSALRRSEELRLTNDEFMQAAAIVVADASPREFPRLEPIWGPELDPMLIERLGNRMRAERIANEQETVGLAMRRGVLIPELMGLIEGAPREQVARLADVMLENEQQNPRNVFELKMFAQLAARSSAFAFELVRVATARVDRFEHIGPTAVWFAGSVRLGRTNKAAHTEIERWLAVLGATREEHLREFWHAAQAAVCWDVLMILCGRPVAFLPGMLTLGKRDFDAYAESGRALLGWLRGVSVTPADYAPVAERQADAEFEHIDRINAVIVGTEQRIERILKGLAREWPGYADRLRLLAREWGLSN